MSTSEPVTTAVGMIGNYYGGLTVRQTGDAYEWSIENYDGHGWEKIPAYLGEALLKFEREGMGAQSESAPIPATNRAASTPAVDGEKA